MRPPSPDICGFSTYLFLKSQVFSYPTKRERLPQRREVKSESQLPFVLGPSPNHASSFFLSFLCRVSYHAGRTVSAGTPVTIVDLLLSWSLPSRGQASFFSVFLYHLYPSRSHAHMRSFLFHTAFSMVRRTVFSIPFLREHV